MARDRFQLVGTCLDGKFQVEQLVAEGGFGIVYSGRHSSLDRPVAIKVLKTPDELNERAREHFISKFTLEAKTIARLNHLNIVQVIDFGVSPMPAGESAPWMVLEWLTGRSLEQDLQRRRGRGGRSPGEALELLEPIFDALAYAHEEGIAHRDVKPANIMIVPTKRGEMLKLLDFGIVKIMDKGETAENLAPTRAFLSAHSPAYAAPEQITGLRTGPWTDVHALALVLTEVMTDLPPYEGKDITTLLREILSPQRPTPARRRIDAGPWEPVLGRALALEPEARFKNAGDFLAALKNAIPAALTPIAAKPQSEEDYIHTQVLRPSLSAREPATLAAKADPALIPKREPIVSPQQQVTPAVAAAPEPVKATDVIGFTKPILLTKRADLRSSWREIPTKWLAASGAAALLAVGLGYWAFRPKPPEPPLATGPALRSSEGTQAGGRDNSSPGEKSVRANQPDETPRTPPTATEQVSRSQTKAAEPAPQPLAPSEPTRMTSGSTGTGSKGLKPTAGWQGTISSTGSDGGIDATPALKRPGDQAGAIRHGRSRESKPMQRTKVELE